MYAGSGERKHDVQGDALLEEEVRRLRAELDHERELRVAAEAVAAERAAALDRAEQALSQRTRRASSRSKLQGNWLR